LRVRLSRPVAGTVAPITVRTLIELRKMLASSYRSRARGRRANEERRKRKTIASIAAGEESNKAVGSKQWAVSRVLRLGPRSELRENSPALQRWESIAKEKKPAIASDRNMAKFCRRFADFLLYEWFASQR